MISFRGELNFNNWTGSLWLTITNVGVLRNGTNADIATNVIGSTFVPQTAETFAYDPDGNMTNDGRLSISWDAENRVTNFSRRSGVAGPNISIDCESDYMGRRIAKIVTQDLTETDYYFIYDGWNIVAVLGLGHQLLYSFNWGADASGTLGGAGGVGGLISMTVHSGPNAGTYFYAYDGNYNVVALVNAANGAVAAQYEYSPFGEVLRATGPMGQVNPFLFSTKFGDTETGFYYYGYRYYSPPTGKWLSEDPLQEGGGPNLSAFTRNSPVSAYDSLGALTVVSSGVTWNTCGGFDVVWGPTLNSTYPFGGILIQKIDFTYNAYTCAGHYLHEAFSYWEAFTVPADQPTSSDYTGTDIWHYDPSPDTHGSLTMRGHFRFFGGRHDVDYPPWISGGTWSSSGSGVNGPPYSISSGSLPSTDQEPSWWDDGSELEEEHGNRLVTVNWNCCCPFYYSEGFVTK